MIKKDEEDNKKPAAKPINKHPGKRRYIARKRLSSADGSEVWNMGAEIWLDDIVGPKHVAKGSVWPADETSVPEPKPATVTHNKAVK